MDRIYHRLEAAAAAAAASMTILRVQTNDQSPRTANEKHASLSSVVNARLLLTFAHCPLTGAIRLYYSCVRLSGDVVCVFRNSVFVCRGTAERSPRRVLLYVIKSL